MSLFHPNDSDLDQWVMDMHVILHILTMSQWLITNKMFVHMWYHNGFMKVYETNHSSNIV